MAACFTQPRNVSGTTPTRGPIRLTAPFSVSDESSDIDSATMRCAGSRSSFGYFLGAGITPPFRGIRPSTRARAVQFWGRFNLMLRTAQLLPFEGLLTLGFDPTRFQTEPPACYRASWQLPGPDSHRQAMTS